jgi:hypothetical protein
MKTKEELMAKILHQIQQTKREYLALGEEICTTMSFQGYCTIKYGSWPKDLDKNLFKGTR